MVYQKDKQGLYYQGKLVADNWTDAIQELYQMEGIPNGFCVNRDYEANGYSVVDSYGVQYIYELSPSEFYDKLMELTDDGQ